MNSTVNGGGFNSRFNKPPQHHNGSYNRDQSYNGAASTNQFHKGSFCSSQASKGSSDSKQYYNASNNQSYNGSFNQYNGVLKQSYNDSLNRFNNISYNQANNGSFSQSISGSSNQSHNGSFTPAQNGSFHQPYTGSFSQLSNASFSPCQYGSFDKPAHSGSFPSPAPHQPAATSPLLGLLPPPDHMSPTSMLHPAQRQQQLTTPGYSSRFPYGGFPAGQTSMNGIATQSVQYPSASAAACARNLPSGFSPVQSTPAGCVPQMTRPTTSPRPTPQMNTTSPHPAQFGSLSGGSQHGHHFGGGTLVNVSSNPKPTYYDLQLQGLIPPNA